MTTVTLNGRTFGMIDVPEGACNFILFRYRGKYWHIDWQYKQPNQYTSAGIALMYKDFGGKKKYPEKMLLHGLASALTETDWQGIVDKATVMDGETGETWAWYKNYKDEGNPYEFADESAQSLLASQGKDAGKVVIVELLK